MRGLVLLAVLMLGACATQLGPTPEEIAAARVAQNIYPAAYKADLLAFLRTYLNNPANVREAAASEPQRKIVGGGERYVVCVRYNARKANGDYAGVKDHVAVFISGKLDQFIERVPGGPKTCEDAVYQPFPELQRLTR